MITEKDNRYFKELAYMQNKITDDFARQVFRRIFMGYYSFKIGKRKDKLVTKGQILEHLIGEGLMQRRPDGTLPDDRKVRESARELLKMGYPVVATSNSKGYYIAERESEIDRPQRQNHERAVAILAVDKGYNKVRALLSGQTRLFM